ncbi:MFS transporter [Armatimonas sp.]|uniref:MFS transporter n=1 Tax=Armatimonas sp. TaxID=1872638 RepID=UPI0037523E81
MIRKPHPPEWLFLLALCAVSALAELGFVIVNISALPYFLKFGIQLPSLAALALVPYYLVEALAGSPMGALADRVGRRRLMVTGACVSIATCLATSQVRVPHGAAAVLGITALVLLLRALDGFGAAMLWPNVYAAAADRVAPERQAQANTLITMAYMAMIAIGPKVGGWLNDRFGVAYRLDQPEHYAPSFLFAAGCFAATAILSYFIAPRRNTPTPGHEEHAPINKTALLRAFHTAPWLLGLIGMIFVAIGLIGTQAKIYLMARFGFTSEESFGNLFLAPAVLIGIVAAPLGRLSDKWGKTRAIRLGTALCAASIWGLLYSPYQSGVALFGSILGSGFVLAFPAYMAYIAEMAPENEKGAMIGSVRMVQGVGAGLGALLSALLLAQGTSVHSLFLVAASILTLGFFLSLVVVKVRKLTS